MKQITHFLNLFQPRIPSVQTDLEKITLDDPNLLDQLRIAEIVLPRFYPLGHMHLGFIAPKHIVIFGDFDCFTDRFKISQIDAMWKLFAQSRRIILI